MNLLDFGRFRGAQPAPLFPGPAQVRAYWEGLRDQGSIPERTAIDPRGLVGALDRVFLAERIARGLVQVRIAGSALAEMAGIDLRGLPLSCLFTANARPPLAEAIEAVATGAALAELDLGGAGGGLVARLLLLPLRDGADRQLVLGCFGLDRGGLSGRAKFTVLCRREEALLPGPATRQTRSSKAPHLALVTVRD